MQISEKRPFLFLISTIIPDFYSVFPDCFPVSMAAGKRMVKQPVLFCTNIVPHCTNIKILFPSFIPHNYGESPINRTFRTIPFSGPVGILLELSESVVFATIFPTSGKWLWGNIQVIISIISCYFDLACCQQYADPSTAFLEHCVPFFVRAAHCLDDVDREDLTACSGCDGSLFACFVSDTKGTIVLLDVAFANSSCS